MWKKDIRETKNTTTELHLYPYMVNDIHIMYSAISIMLPSQTLTSCVKTNYPYTVNHKPLKTNKGQRSFE